jgi:hypothetical protein
MNKHFDDAKACISNALETAESLQEKTRLLRYAFILQTAAANLSLSLDGIEAVHAYVAERFEGDAYVRMVGELDSREGRHLLKRQGLAINPGRRSAGTVELFPLRGTLVKPVVDAEVLRVYLECAYWKACATNNDPHEAVGAVLRQWVAAAVAEARRPSSPLPGPSDA